MGQFHEYLKVKSDKIFVLLSSPNDMTAQTEYYSLLIMYALNRRIFNTKDQERDLFKKIWGLQKLCPLIIVYNNIKCSPGQFLMTMCPLAKKSNSLVPKEVGPFLMDEMKQRNANFQVSIQSFYMRLVDWIIKMNSDFLRAEVYNGDDKYLERRALLINVGINLATQIKRTVKSLLMIH